MKIIVRTYTMFRVECATNFYIINNVDTGFAGYKKPVVSRVKETMHGSDFKFS